MAGDRRRKRRMGVLVVAALAAVVVAGCAAGGGHRPGARAEASGPDAGAQEAGSDAGARPASRLMELVEAGEVRSIRLVGDSITAGFGTDGYVNADVTGEGAVVYDDGEEVHRETSSTANSWANAFRSWAAEHGVRDFVNAGVNGAFMAGLAASPDAWLADGADVVFVALGTNDAGYYGPEEYRQAAEEALCAAAQRAKLVVAVAPVCDLRPESTLVEPASVLGDVLGEVCAEGGYEFVDPRPYVTPDLFCDDGLHPNSAGSLAIWACVRDTLGL